MKCVIFTARSIYARFRRPHTTTSALTFTTIHPIAVKGLIGAIIGIDYNELYENTKDLRIGIQVLNPVYKDMQSFNLIPQANCNKAASFQSRIEFLRDVEYRIFVSNYENELNDIASRLNKGEFVFTPYLGCSEHIAKIQYEGEYEVKITDDLSVDTIIPLRFADLSLETDFMIYTDRIPMQNNENRDYTEYEKVIFSHQNRIGANGTKIFKVGDYNVFFF